MHRVEGRGLINLQDIGRESAHYIGRLDATSYFMTSAALTPISPIEARKSTLR